MPDLRRKLTLPDELPRALANLGTCLPPDTPGIQASAVDCMIVVIRAVYLKTGSEQCTSIQQCLNPLLPLAWEFFGVSDDLVHLGKKKKLILESFKIAANDFVGLLNRGTMNDTIWSWSQFRLGASRGQDSLITLDFSAEAPQGETIQELIAHRLHPHVEDPHFIRVLYIPNEDEPLNLLEQRSFWVDKIRYALMAIVSIHETGCHVRTYTSDDRPASYQANTSIVKDTWTMGEDDEGSSYFMLFAKTSLAPPNHYRGDGTSFSVFFPDLGPIEALCDGPQ